VSVSCRRVAALDLGTNTFLALVAELDERGELRVVEDVFRTPRLGEGLARTGQISEAGMQRGLDALLEFTELLSRCAVDHVCVRAVGTAVFRRASNSAEFVERVRRELGLAIEVVSGEVEGELSYAAARSTYGDGGDDVSVIDVGGGSTELAWNGGRSRVSARVGAVVLTEAHQGDLAGHAWSDAAWESARLDVEAAFDAALTGAPPRPASSGRVTALGGSAANLAALEAQFAMFEPAKTEGLVVTAAAAREFAERLRRLDLEARRTLPIEAERAVILPAGLLCLGAALERLDARAARASGKGLRYGLAWKSLRDLRP